MFTRKTYEWIVKLQDDQGAVVDYPVSAYWDPAKEGCDIAIGLAAKGMAFWASGSIRKYAILGVSRA